MKERVIFEVDGVEYGGITSVAITKSLGAVAGEFSATYTELWPGRDEPWPILPHSPVRILLGNDVLINGYVDRLPISFGGERHALTAMGRDRTGQIVDCDPKPSPGEFRSTNLEKLARAFARQMNIDVTRSSSVSGLETLPVFRPTVGQSVHRAIEEQARKDNVMLGPDESGRLSIFRPGNKRSSVGLVYGRNVTAGEVDHDWSGRYSHYIVEGQAEGLELLPGPASQVFGEAHDRSVKLPRLKRIRAENGMDNTAARKRAEWEASTRAATSVSLSLPMRGWRQNPDDPGSELWSPGLLVPVDIAPAKLDEDMLVEFVSYVWSDQRFRCSMRLTRPDAWAPKPPSPEADPLAPDKLGGLYG